MPGSNSAAAATVLSEQEASKSHRRGLIIAVAAVVVVLAGLGAYLALGSNSTKGGGGKGGAKSATATAATATLHEKSAHVAIDVKETSAALGQTDGPSAVGDFDLSKSQGTMTVTVPALPPPGTTADGLREEDGLRRARPGAVDGVAGQDVGVGGRPPGQLVVEWRSAQT